MEIVEADAELHPVLLEFGNEDVDARVVDREMPPVDEDVHVDDEGEHHLPEEVAEACSRNCYQRFLTRYHRWVQKQAAAQADDVSAERVSSRLSLADKSLDQKSKLAREYWNSEPQADSELERRSILAHWRQRAEQHEAKSRRRWFRGTAALFTYNGDWGVMEDISPPMTRTASARDEILDVVLKCQSSKRLLEVWQDFQKFWTKIVAKYHFQHYACAFELCATTLEDSRAVRVHAHVACRAASRVSVESASVLRWQGVEPHLGRNFSANRQRAAGGNACFYYLQCPKIGVVYQAANIQPFRDYLVSGEWVFNLLQSEKMTIEHAREEIIRTAKNLQRLLPNLDAYAKCIGEKKLEAHIAQVQNTLAAASKPFLRIESIERWKEDHLAILPRYKFLVLVGPSGLGKTQYAKALVPFGRALELNMAAAPEPDLKAYSHEKHDLILFDECPAKVILKQKKLFQAPAVHVALAASVTGCYSYQVWLHQKLLVVCSNVWHHELREFPAEDRDWLVSNSLVYTVEQPLWCQDEDAALGDPSGSVPCSQADTP